VYALGDSNPVSAFLAGFPLVREFRGPFRAALFFNLSVYALAGGLIASNMRSGQRRKVDVFVSCAIGLLLGVGFVLAAYSAHRLLAVERSDVYISAGIAAISIILVFPLLFSQQMRTPSAFLLIGLLALDICFHYGKFFSPARVDELFAKDATASFLEERVPDARILVRNTAEANYFALFGIESVNGHHPFGLLRQVEFLGLLEHGPQATQERLASLAGVKFHVDYNPDKAGPPAHPPVDDQNEVSVSGMPLDPLPRAFLVNRFKVAPSSEAAFTALQADFDPASEAILEQEPGVLELAPSGEAHGQATIKSREENHVVVETESADDALLVLTDTYYPGWRAKVDGSDAEILRADYVFRAVVLPAGNHTVEFEFRPIGFLVGAALSCLGGLIWLGAALALPRVRAGRRHSKT
jgi:hypothetical protein